MDTNLVNDIMNNDTKSIDEVVASESGYASFLYTDCYVIKC